MQEPSSGFIGRGLTPDKTSRFLTGRGTYVADIRLPSMAHAALARSLHAHARIRVDASEARSLEGVLGVWTGAEIAGRIAPFPESFEIHPAAWLEGVKPLLRGPRPEALAREKVHYVGEPLAVVVAEDRHLAEDAADLIRVDYDPLPVLADPEEALRPGAALVHDGAPDNIVFSFTVTKGDVEGALRTAPRRLAERFRHHRYCAAPLEGRGVVAWAEPKTGVLTVWSSTQMPHLVRRQIAAQLGLPEALVRVIAPDVGGGFGPKVFVYPEEVLIPYLSLCLRRPVKWIEDRREHFVATAHARDQVHWVELGFDLDGRILALRDRFVLDNGAYNPMGLTDAYNTAAHLQGPYRIPNFSVSGTCVSTNKVPNAPYRGAGRPEAVFVMERSIDLIAGELGLDPAEARRRNFVRPEEMPYLAGMLYRDGRPICYDSGDFPETLARALAAADYEGWKRRRDEPGRNGRRIGVGIGCYVEGTGVGSFEGARVRIDAGGRLIVATGATAHGQGHETVFAQIAADLWGVTPDDVVVIEGDTAAIPFGCGAFASRSSVAAGSAIYEASARLQEKTRRLAAHLLEARPDDLRFGGGKVFVREAPGRAVTFADLARAALPGWASNMPAGLEPGLEETFYYVPPTVTWANAAHVAVVEVDTETGEIRLLDYAVAHDAGKLINPLFVAGQIHGGVAQGIGAALYEEIVYDGEGQPLNPSFMHYLLPSAAEIPRIKIVHLDSPSSLNPLGVKGLGEGGAIAPPAAIANALADALGGKRARVNEIPLHPERVLQILADAEGAK
ncbi:MAG TPA: xanthine dehydrogenase family protein molybdopterin-binding subunit [candidate division Zixibacteria bacterium]|nr:xanthine dehydrogenase family protein molybdopterin-binding subunit [candidate division Zixibacteria bacterium]